MWQIKCWVDQTGKKNLLRSLNLECKPFSSSMVKTDFIKKTQKIESISKCSLQYHYRFSCHRCYLCCCSFIILDPSSRNKRKDADRTLSNVCQNKQIEIMKEDILPFQPTPLQKVWAPVSFLHGPTVVPIRHQLVSDMSPGTYQIVLR